ncbi:MAG: hypothetical protein H7X95_04695, partial [Deltaproteobacteria bacterium]|nr:hypothetical protein [Deltaproteobacteria bacterium]
MSHNNHDDGNGNGNGAATSDTPTGESPDVPDVDPVSTLLARGDHAAAARLAAVCGAWARAIA